MSLYLTQTKRKLLYYELYPLKDFRYQGVYLDTYLHPNEYRILEWYAGRRPEYDITHNYNPKGEVTLIDNHTIGLVMNYSECKTRQEKDDLRNEFINKMRNHAWLLLDKLESRIGENDLFESKFIYNIYLNVLRVYLCDKTVEKAYIGLLVFYLAKLRQYAYNTCDFYYIDAILTDIKINETTN